MRKALVFSRSALVACLPAAQANEGGYATSTEQPSGGFGHRGQQVAVDVAGRQYLTYIVDRPSVREGDVQRRVYKGIETG